MNTIKIKRVSSIDINKIFEFELNLEGTEKQFEYAVSIIQDRFSKTEFISQNLIQSGKITKDEYYDGMDRFIKALESITSAKYVIEHVH